MELKKLIAGLVRVVTEHDPSACVHVFGVVEEVEEVQPQPPGLKLAYY